jgi:energy-coupling factor transport system substrate-specific component
MRLSASAFTNLYASSNLPSKVVNTVTKWQDSLYIGTDKGLDIIKDGKKIQTELSSQLASVRIRCIK